MGAFTVTLYQIIKEQWCELFSLGKNLLIWSWFTSSAQIIARVWQEEFKLQLFYFDTLFYILYDDNELIYAVPLIYNYFYHILSVHIFGLLQFLSVFIFTLG